MQFTKNGLNFFAANVGQKLEALKIFGRSFGLDSYGCILPMSDFMSYDHASQDRFARKFLHYVSQGRPGDEKIDLVQK
jgi:hypothetical protein